MERLQIAIFSATSALARLFRVLSCRLLLPAEIEFPLDRLSIEVIGLRLVLILL